MATSLVLSVTVAQALADDGETSFPAPRAPSADQSACTSGDGSSAGYPDASPTEAADLFTQEFGCILDSLASDPSDTQADDAGALPAPAPIHVTDQTGDGVPVDLTLVPSSDGFQPVNPIVDVTLPTDLGNGVAVGDQGIALDVGATDPQAASASSAEPLGGGLFYADAAPATDVDLAPVSTGLEAAYQLRGPTSPDRLEIGVTLPKRASLENGAAGSALVVDGGQAVASIYPSLAIDADGNPVPASLTVNGDSLELDVPHSDPGIAYPVAVTTTAVTSFASAASATPQLGYDAMQAGDDNLASNLNLAHIKNATWVRTGNGSNSSGATGVGYAETALTYGLTPIVTIRRPHCQNETANPPPLVCNPTELPSAYRAYCYNLALAHPSLQYWEVMNEPNHKTALNDDGKSQWGPALYASDYALYFRHCRDGLYDARPVWVLGASIVQSTGENSGSEPAVGDPWAWLAAVNQDPRANFSWILSAHIYPSGADLDSAAAAANALEFNIWILRYYTNFQRGITITEMGIKNETKVPCSAKPNYLVQMFQRAGSNAYYNASLATIFRFTRNRGPTWTDAWATAGVWDSTINSRDLGSPVPPGDIPLINGYYNGSQDCGLTALADAVH